MYGSLKDLLPRRIKNMVFQELASNDETRRRDEVARLPLHRLEDRHIANLKTVPTRQDLLRCLPKNAVVAEMGVDEGSFSRDILLMTQPVALHLIDSWDSPRYGSDKMDLVRERFKREVAAGQIKVHRGTSLEILRAFPDRYFSWVYIDTDHSYETTSQELRICRTKVKDRGIIAGHDYVCGNWITGYKYGVIEAVREFCVLETFELIFMTCEPDHYLSFAIREILPQG